MLTSKITLKYPSSIIALILLFTSPASSHGVAENGSGMGHALTELEHSVVFILVGILVAALMLTRKKPAVIAGNIALLGFLIWGAFSHTTGNSLLPGFEFFMGAALLSLASWRAVYLLIHVSNWAKNRGKILFYFFLNHLDNYLKFQNAKAHCDIPCKIYDPAIATVSALSVIRLIDIINETSSNEDQASVDCQNTIARCIQRKEEESEKLKQEIRIIWGDYFKEPQIDSFPEIHDLTHQIMLLASGAKQRVDRDQALTLLESVNKFSEIFWSTKGIETERKIAPYPPSLEVVRPK